ncbi:hypothetical protein KP509_16G004500 [Ceratopteris richardii]|nr:hypothetical protein KP509_16G004500 [Ceratopteris richardii]
MNPTEVDSIEHQGQPQPTWTFIKQNIFQHRQRKVEEIDEQMICSCEPPEDGSLGCGEDCLNRSLNIECISQTCPCGDACSNQRFQKQSYKKVAFFQCGKKGFGLQVLENVPKGDFILEYVGEVLNSTAYEARHHEYQQNGQKHYYFMALSDSEIIDAYCKGNLGRFINHSCQPNCNVEKWMINGEVCVGVFANRELKKGEEITVDVGAFGAAAIECLCGSHRCRGVIGGDSVNPLDARNKDFDTDFTEPAMDVSFIEESKRIKSARQKPHHENKWTAQKNGRHFEGVEEELNKLVDENGGLRKGQPFVATSFLKLLVRTYASLMSAERSRSSRDISMVLDALLKTHSRAILLDILTTHGFQVLHKMLKQNKKDYKRTPIIRKLLKVLEFLAARRVLTVDQINAVPTRSNMESLKDTIFELGRHGDVEIRHMAHHFKDTYLKASSEKLARRNQVGSSDSSKWRLFPKQNQGGTSAPDVAEHDNTKKRKRSSRWDQPSRDVLEITQTADHRVKQTDGASMDELGQTYPGLPSLLSPESQNIAEGAEQGPGVLSVRRDQFSAASTGHVSQQQQGPICIGIPVSQFHGVGGPAPELSCVPQVLNSCPVVHPPDRHVSSFGSSTMKMQEQRQHEFNDQSTKTENEKVKVNFGVSHSHFFEEMREMFGSAFHPWQIQCLMASHAWGPYLTGDARLRELGPINDSASVFRQSNQYRSTEESSSKLAEQTGSWGPVQDVELPASGVTSLPPSSALPQFTHPMPMNAPNVSSGMLSMAGDAERGNAPYIHSKSSSYRPQQWDSSSLSRFHGNRYRNTGMSRDSSHSLQPHHQNIGSQDLNPHRSHPHNWKESSWKNLDSNQGYPNVQGANNATTTAPGVDGRHDAVPDPSFHDSQNTSRNMSLENSTGHNQQYPSRDHISFYGNVS